MTIVFQSSVIFVKDVDASRHFYEDLLGQEVAFDFGENVSFVGGFAIHDAEHISQLVFGRSAEDVDRLGRENFELYFETPEIEAVLARLSEAGTAFVHPIREQPWGQRVARLYDPDGHVVEIGEPIPAVVQRFLEQGLPVEEAARRSSMPLEVVQQIAATMASED